MSCCGGGCEPKPGVKVGDDLWAAMKEDEKEKPEQHAKHIDHDGHSHANDEGCVEEMDISTGGRLKDKLKQRRQDEMVDTGPVDHDWEDEKAYWAEEAKGTRSKYSFWLMILVALPMLTGLIPVYEFTAAKMEEHDVLRRVGMTLGVAETYEEEIRGIYAKYAPWKTENKTEFNGHMWGLMTKWSGKEQKLIKKLHRKYVMLPDKKVKPRKKKSLKDDAFYQYQQRKQAKKDRQRKMEAEKKQQTIAKGKGGAKGKGRGNSQAEREQARRKELDEEAAKHIPESVGETNESDDQKEANSQDGPVIDLDQDKNDEL